MAYAATNRKWLRKPAVVISAVFLSLLSLVGFADAQTLTWSGTGSFLGPGTWNSSNSNWWNGSANQTWNAGNIAAFGVSTGTGSIVTVSGSQSVGGIIFNPLSVTGTAAGSSFTLTGGTIGIGSGNSILTSGTASNMNGLHTIASTLEGSNLSVGRASGAGASTFAPMGVILSGTNPNLTGTLTVGGALNTQSVRVLATGAAVSGISSVVLGTSSVFGASADNSVFNFNVQMGTSSNLMNNFGHLTVSGTIALAGDNAQVSGNAGKTTILQGPIVDVSGGTAKTLTLSNRGTTVLSGASTFSGTWAMSQPNSGGAVILDGGNNRLPSAASVSFTTSTNTLVLGTSAALNQTLAGLSSDGTKASNAVLGGATGTSTLTVNLASGTNTFFGQLGGTAYTVNGGSVTNANGNNLALVKSGAGTFILAGNSSYLGGTQINGGVLSLSNSGALGTTGTISFGGGILQFSGSNQADYSARFSTAANQAYSLDTNGQLVSLATALTSVGGSLTKLGTGTLALSTANTFDGGTVIGNGSLVLDGGTDRLSSSGALTIGSSGAAGRLVLGGTAASSQSVSSLATTGSGGSIVGGNAATSTLVVNLTTGSTMFAGALGGVGTNENNLAFEKRGAGTLALSGSSSFTGGITLTAGQLNINNANALGGASNTFTIGGGTLDNTSGGSITVAVNNAQNWNGDFTFVGSNPLNLGTGAVAMNASRQLTVTSSTLTVGGGIAGSGFGITKGGGGVLTLSGSSTFTGGVTLNAGTIVIAHSNALGTGTATLAGGQLNLQNNAIVNSLNVTGSSQLSFIGNNLSSSAAVLGSGTLTISSVDAGFVGTIQLGSFTGFSGLLNVTRGQVTPYGSALTNARLNLSGTSAGALAVYNQQGWNGDANIGELSGNQFGQLQGGGGTVTYVVGGLNTSSEFAGAIISSAATLTSLRKVGTGALTLSGSSTFAGGVTLAAGQLNVNNANALGAASGTFTITSGTLGNTSGGTVTVAGNNAQNWNGDFTFAGSHPLNLGTGAVAMNASRQVTVTSSTLTIGGGIAGAGFGLTKAGAGGLSLSGSSTFTGGVTLNAGAIVVAHSSALGTGTVTMNAGILSQSNNISPTNMLNVLGSGSVAVTGNAQFGGLTGSGTLTVVGTGANQYTLNAITGFTGQLVGTNVNLRGNGADSASTSAMDLVLGAGGNYAVNGFTATAQIGALTGTDTSVLQAGNGAVTYAIGGLNRSTEFRGVIRDSGTATSLTKVGTAVLTLSGSNTFTGATSITAGRLDIGQTGSLNGTSGITVNGSTAEFKYNSAGTLTQPLTLTRGTLSGTGTIGSAVSVGSNSILSPGNSPGIQAFTQGLTFASGGQYTWEINNWTGEAGSAFDQLSVSGSALNITATSGSTFKIAITGLTAGNVSGAVPSFSNSTGTSFTIATSSAGITGFDKTKFTLDTTGFTNNNTLATNAGFWVSQSGNNLLLNYAPSATYDLAANATAAAIRVGGTSWITATVTSSTTAVTNPDSVGYGGLALSGGLGSLSSTSGTLAGGLVGSGSAAFSTLATGSYSFSPSVTTATNVNIGTNANAGSTSGASVLVYNPANANTLSAVSLGNIRVGTSFGTQSLSIWNTGTAAAAYQEGLAVSVSGTTGGASGSGSFSNLFASSTSTAISVGLGNANTATAGAKSGAVSLGFTSTGTTSGGATGLTPLSLGSQSIAVTGTAWNPASANTLSGTIHLGAVLKGTPLSQSLSILNTAPNDGFSEKLDVAFGTSTGNATTSGGPISLLAAGSTSTALAVGLDSATAGGKAGSVQVNFASNGDGTSGLSMLSLAPQTVSLTATVLDPATAVLVGGTTSGSAWSIDLGEFNQGAGTSSPFSFGISNILQTTGYTADLDLTSFSLTSNSGAIFTTLSGTSFPTLIAGGTNPFSAWMSLATTGSFSNVYSLSFNSSKNGTGLGGTPQNVTLTVHGVIVVPEPGALALAGLGIGLAGWSLSKRRRNA